MTPLVELAMETCLDAGCQGRTTGTVNPGLVWFGRYIQLGIEARIPIDDRSGRNVGVSALFHVFADDVLDELFARPHHHGIE
jgi:hypothetical protein